MSVEINELVTIELISYCMENPGIEYPGFCSVFGNGNDVEQEARFICAFGKIKMAYTDEKRSKYAVACGFINGTFSTHIKAYKNSVIVCKNNINYSLSGYYAFYFNKLEKLNRVPGQQIITPVEGKDVELIKKIIDVNGYRGITTTSEDAVAMNIDRESGSSEINSLGIGFSDEGYQKGVVYYPKAYIPKTMKENILLACDFLDQYGRFESCNIISVSSEEIKNGIVQKKQNDIALINHMSDLFEKRICPGMVEITYQGNRWEDKDYIKNMAYAFSDILEDSWKCNKGQDCYVYNCVMGDGSLLCVTSLREGSGVRVMCHFDGKTLVGDLHGINMWENGSENKMLIVKEEDI